tara:strand:+ start:2608 stop:3450 length:843 start_codon:yes stop_codon:yes gene_type:complete
MAWAMAVGAAVSIGTGLIKGGKAKKAKRKAQEELDRQAAALKDFESRRQSPINPYSGIKNMSSMVKDLSGNLSNPFANVGVATQAAEFKAQQSDMALAATLDTLQATGASAGGATALANAALKSKKDVSATLEVQEAKNSQLQAQGEAKLQQLTMNEQARVQSGKINAQSQYDQLQAKGEQFRFSTQENRDAVTLDRMAGQMDQSRLDVNNAQNAQDSALSSIIGGVGSAVGAGIQSGAFQGAGGDGELGGAILDSGNLDTSSIQMPTSSINYSNLTLNQ